jgi:hypothetical protein
MEKLVRGVALVAFGAFVVGAGYGLVQQMVKNLHPAIAEQQRHLRRPGAARGARRDRCLQKRQFGD